MRSESAPSDQPQGEQTATAQAHEQDSRRPQVVAAQRMEPAIPSTRTPSTMPQIPAIGRRIEARSDAGQLETERIPTLAPGELAPDFLSRNLEGEEVRLSDWRGRVLVLDFWATWCGPCMASLPHVQAVAERCKDQGVVVLAVCTGDTRESFEQFVTENQSNYPDLIFTCDPHERGSATFDDRASHKLYGVRGIPTQFVMGRDGKIAAVLVGYDEGEQRLEDALEGLGIQADTGHRAEVGP